MDSIQIDMERLIGYLPDGTKLKVDKGYYTASSYYTTVATQYRELADAWHSRYLMQTSIYFETLAEESLDIVDDHMLRWRL